MKINNAEEDRTETYRKIEFDKGIPLNINFPDNSVHSIDFKFFSTIWGIIKNIFKRPNYFLLLFLYIFYIIGLIINSEEALELEV